MSSNTLPDFSSASLPNLNSFFCCQCICDDYEIYANPWFLSETNAGQGPSHKGRAASDSETIAKTKAAAAHHAQLLEERAQIIAKARAEIRELEPSPVQDPDDLVDVAMQDDGEMVEDDAEPIEETFPDDGVTALDDLLFQDL